MNIKIKLLEHAYRAPERKSLGASGYDLYSADDIIISTHGDESVFTARTGVCMELPFGIEAQVRPRSSIPQFYCIHNSPGTIDSDYRGEILVRLRATHPYVSFKIKRGDRIAQLVFSYVINPMFLVVNSLSDTERGDGGFGSTGE